MRRKIIAGNWKMSTSHASAHLLAEGVLKGLTVNDRIGVILCPPFPYLLTVAQVLHGGPIALGAQNLYPELEGAFTGEVSPTMLLDVGCQYVILGHSERRHRLSESDAFINRKVHAALKAGLNVILCIGETLEERQAGKTEIILGKQLDGSLANVAADALTNLVIAYEPVWAIGTGVNATPEQAQQAHHFLRQRLAARYDRQLASAVHIQYGGSVKPDNAASLLHQPDVDGALVGGASLKADSFLAIVNAATPST